MARIEAERISVLPARPRSTRRCSPTPGAPNTTSRHSGSAWTGAAVVPVELVEAMATSSASTTVLTAYAHRVVRHLTMCRRSDPPGVVSATSGAPSRPRGARRGRGREVPTGEPGEIVVRATRDVGYWERRGDAEAIDPEAGCTPGHRVMDAPETHHHGPGQGHVLGRLQRYRGDRGILRATRRWPGRVVGIPDERRGGGLRLCVPAHPARPHELGRHPRLVTGVHGQLQMPRSVCWSTRCRERQWKCSNANCASATRPALDHSSPTRDE